MEHVEQVERPAPRERWVFGVPPLPESQELAALTRRVIGLALSLEMPDRAVQRLIGELKLAEVELAGRVPSDMRPRLGPDPSPERRIYLDHGFNVGAYNPCFPEYEIAVDGMRATGTVTFPLVYEGPPNLVHGGVLATFFDLAVQQHNCLVGIAGKTTSLLLKYRRPTPIDVELRYEIEREDSDTRITSIGKLFNGDELLVTATMDAVRGDRRNLPEVSPRRWAP